MKYKIWIGLIILFFLLSGCTYRDELISSGKDTFRKGDLDKAEEIFAELTQFSPRYHAGYLYLGFINLYQDKINEAIKYFEKSLVLNDQPDLEYLGLGQAYLAMSKYDLAREYLEKARMVEQYPVTEYLLGFIYLYAGESEKAQEKLHTASKSYPERGEIWAALGKVLLENHKILDAVQAYQMAYIYGIKTYDLYFGLAEAYYFLGNNRQAIAIIEQALAEPYLSDQEREELGMKLAQYNMNENPSKAIESLEKILKITPNKAEVMLMLGQLYYQQEKYDKTINIYEIFLQKHQPLAEVYYLIYCSYFGIDNQKMAEEYLKQAIKLKSDNIPYYLELLNLYHINKNWKEAIKVYQTAIKLAPDRLDLLVNLSNIYIKNEDPQNAIIYLSKAIELEPIMPELYLKKAQMHFKLSQTELEESTYQALLDIAPNHLLAINNLAQIFRDTNRLDQAFELYQKANSLDPINHRYLKSLGYILLLQKDYLSARDWLEQAIVRNPDDYEGYRFLGDTYFAQDEYHLAVKNYEKSLEIKSDYHYAMYPLAKSYFYLNEFDLATKYFEAYLKRYPLNEGSKFYLTRIQWLKDQKVTDTVTRPADE